MADLDESDPDEKSDSDSDSDCFCESDEEPDMEQQLRDFRSTAKLGQLFYRHAGSRRRSKPQDRVIKVSFDHTGEPSEVSWGRGTRHIKFADILYIASGHWTPTFDLRKERLNERQCLSI